jgi:RNA-binding protein
VTRVRVYSLPPAAFPPREPRGPTPWPTTMPATTNPKKRALMPSSPLRRALRGAGHHLSAVVQVGKEGVTPAVLRQLSEALLAHELVKVKVGAESPEDRFEVADRLGQEADAKIAQVLGMTVLVYRRHPEKPRFEPLHEADAKRPPRPVGERSPHSAARARPSRPWKRPRRKDRDGRRG